MAQGSNVVVESVSKKFARRVVFSGVEFSVAAGTVQGITGKNGSGKSTLMKIIAGLMEPNAGTIRFESGSGAIKPEEVFRHIGYAAPYITLFEEFSAMENLALFAKVRAMPFYESSAADLLISLGLPTDRSDPIRTFSSGMMQRMRLAFAVSHQPEFLFLDEPSSNLDEDGFAVVRSIVEDFRREKCVIIATNDYDDLRMCDAVYSVDGSAPAHRGA